MTRPDLDTLIARAHHVEVRPDHARAYVGELARWARSEPEPSRRWFPWLVAGLGVAVAIAAVLLVGVRTVPTPPGDEPVRVGERVAIVADPGTGYRVIASDADHTELLVEHGTVTARLFPGSQPHTLALRGAGLEAIATGTVYSLTVDDRGAAVAVHEGKVSVRRGTEQRIVPAGTTWPPRATGVGASAAGRLLAMATPPPVTVAPPAGSPRPDAATDAAIDAQAKPPAPDANQPVAPTQIATLPERWRTARLFRAQGKFDAAIAECMAIADAHDGTWSPIALVEAARIELGPRAAPERTVTLVDRFEREWPTHGLGPEARELRCRALRQLGRACAPTDAGP